MPKGSSIDPVPASSADVESHAYRARARLGSTLRGKWRLDDLLGVGGMAAVYAATHRNGTQAAVKVLHPELSVDDTLRRRFFREGHIANKVGHPGVLRVLDDDVADDGSLYLVTELLQGESVEDRRVRSGGTLSEEETLPIVDQLLDVLTAAHSKEVVHRDVKPENLFLTTSGELKLLDFGIARAPGVKGTQPTRAGVMLGTPAFMAPEQARGLWEEVDGRTDLWAVGATMFRLLSGSLVHVGRTPNEELLAAMTNPAPPLAPRAPTVSGAVCRIVDRALAFEKSARFADAEEMQQALRAVHASPSSPSRPATVRVIVPEAVARHGVAPLRDLYDDEAVDDTEVAHGSLTRPKPPPPGSARAPTDEAISRTLAAGVPTSRRAPLWLLGAGAVALLSAVLAVAAGRNRSSPAVPTAAATSPEPPAPPSSSTPAVSAALPSAAPPGASSETPAASARPRAPDRPIASGSATARPPATTPASPRAQSAKAPLESASPSCNPPYVIDPVTGRHDWKLECLR